MPSGFVCECGMCLFHFYTNLGEKWFCKITMGVIVLDFFFSPNGPFTPLYFPLLLAEPHDCVDQWNRRMMYVISRLKQYKSMCNSPVCFPLLWQLKRLHSLRNAAIGDGTCLSVLLKIYRKYTPPLQSHTITVLGCSISKNNKNSGG